MDIFNLLSYINKASLLAFIVTILIVGYQVYILRKEKKKEQAPTIPDFREAASGNKVVANFTNLPASLTMKEAKKANYSKLIFLIISLLTIMVVIFVFILIRRNNAGRNQALVTPPAVATPAPVKKTSLSPTAKAVSAPTSAPTLPPELPPPTLIPLPSPTIFSSLSPTVSLTETTCTGQACLTPTITIIPTEIILAKTNLTSTIGPTGSRLETLPETGNVGKGLLIIGAAISVIFFSFWF